MFTVLRCVWPTWYLYCYGECYGSLETHDGVVITKGWTISLTHVASYQQQHMWAWLSVTQYRRVRLIWVDRFKHLSERGECTSQEINHKVCSQIDDGWWNGALIGQHTLTQWIWSFSTITIYNFVDLMRFVESITCDERCSQQKVTKYAWMPYLFEQRVKTLFVCISFILNVPNVHNI